MTTARSILLVVALVGLTIGGCAAAPPAAPAVPPPPTTAQAGSTTVVAVAPPAQPCCKQNLWEFLGVDKLFQGIGALGNRILSRLGSRFPGLEPKPALTPIADPANMNSPNPAVSSAANAKAQEDQAPQKIKALNYLATLGCAGCYPGIEEAMLAGLDDCTESVRYAAAKALRDTTGSPCQSCNAKACCSEKVQRKLYHVANDTKENGCFKESSARVRRMARMAMAGCGGPVSLAVPEEGPSLDPTPPGKPAEGPATASATGPAAATATASAGQTQLASATSVLKQEPTLATFANGEQSADPAELASPEFASPEAGTPATIAPEKSLPALPVSAPQINALPTPAHRPSCGCSACSAPANGAGAGLVLARVNGEPVYGGPIERIVDAHMLAAGVSGESEAGRVERRELLRAELQHAIDRKILCQQANQANQARQTGAGVIATVSHMEPIGPQTSARPATPATAGEEETLAADWLRRQVSVDETVTPQELAAYYRANLARFRQAAQLRWEQVTASQARFAEAELAYRVVLYCRQRALGQNVPAPEADLTQVVTNTHHWADAAQAPAPVIAQALAGLQVGQISPVLQDGAGFHLVRLLERVPARVQSATEVEPELRRLISEDRRARAEAEYLRQARGNAHVWTIFD